MDRKRNFLLLAYLSIGGLLSLSVWLLLFLPDYLARHDWSSQKIGWAMGSFFLLHLVAQTLTGHLSERYGNVRTALLGSLLACAGGILYLLSLTTLDLIFLARIFHGAGAGLVSAGVLIHLVHSVPSELRGRMIGYFGLPGFVMLGLGPPLSEWLQGRWGLAATLLLLLVLFATVGAMISRLPRPLSRRRHPRPFLVSARLNWPPLKSILLFSFTFGFSFSVWPSFLAPAVAQTGKAAVSSFGIGYGTGAVLSRLGLSPNLDRGRGRLVAISSLILYGGGLALLPGLSSPVHFAAAGLLCGISHGVYYPALSSVAAERFHPLLPGTGMSLYISASSLGMFLGSPLWGVLADRTGYAGTFLAAGVLLALSTGYFLLSEVRRVPSKEARQPGLERRTTLGPPPNPPRPAGNDPAAAPSGCPPESGTEPERGSE